MKEMKGKRKDRKFGMGFINTGAKAIFADTGANKTYLEKCQHLLKDEALRALLDIEAPAEQGRFKGSIIGKDVFIGEEVEIEEGVVVLGHAVINKGKLQSRAVVINSLVDELYAEGGSLTYVVYAPGEKIYVAKGNLVTDVFIKRECYLDIAHKVGDAQTYTMVSNERDFKKRRTIGRVWIEGDNIKLPFNHLQGEVIKGGKSILLEGNIRVHVPIDIDSNALLDVFRVTGRKVEEVIEGEQRRVVDIDDWGVFGRVFTVGDKAKKQVRDDSLLRGFEVLASYREEFERVLEAIKEVRVMRIILVMTMVFTRMDLVFIKNKISFIPVNFTTA